MAKKIIRPSGRRGGIRNGHLIGAGNQFKKVKNPDGSTNWGASVRKQSGQALPRSSRSKIPRPNPPSFNPVRARPVAKAALKRVVRPPVSKANVTPVRRPPTIKKAPRISRGPKR